jgi:hypothetical protein
MVIVGRQLVAIGVLVLVAASPLSLHAFAGDAARPAECHFHAGHQSSLQPVNYSCCQSGHDTPLAEAAAVLWPSATYGFEPVFIPTTWPQQSSPTTLSDGPPISPPLLI